MARSARYRQNTKGFAKVLTSKQMQDAMKDRAEQVQQRAEAIAPRDTGDYGSSFRVDVGIREGPKPRAVAKVINDDVAAPYVEWGTSKTPRFRVMGRAAGSA